MQDIIKTGSSSIIIGSKFYEGHFAIKSNKLLKITKIGTNHNEFNYLDKVKKIENYKDYYAIPDEERKLIQKGSLFFNKLKLLVKDEEMSIFNTNLYVMYIDFAGSTDVLDSLDYLSINGKSYIWKNYNSILNFSKQIICSLKYLHDNKLCHLDIKPENIMVSIKNGISIFKLIDFGFCSEEPFENFVGYYKGTPGYYPSDLVSIEYIKPGLPKIIADDMELVNGKRKMYMNRKLVYKIDSYCLGRVINYIYYHFLENYIPICYFDFNYEKRQKIEKIINLLIEKSSCKRITITELYNMNLI